MKLHHRILLITIASAIAAPGAVFAAKSDGGKSKGKAPTFAAADKNSDGFVTKDEFLAAVQASGGNAKGAEKQFAAKDKDSDGKLSKQEFGGGNGKGGGKKKDKNT